MSEPKEGVAICMYHTPNTTKNQIKTSRQAKFTSLEMLNFPTPILNQPQVASEQHPASSVLPLVFLFLINVSNHFILTHINTWREAAKSPCQGLAWGCSSLSWCPVTGHKLPLRKPFFPARVAEHRPKLPSEVAESPSSEIFKSCPDAVLGNLLSVALLEQEGRTRNLQRTSRIL